MNENNFRKAIVLFDGIRAGVIEENAEGYTFIYDAGYINKGRAVSVSLPLRKEPYISKELFSFFAGLIPEGWYLDTVCMKLKLDKKDTFGILISTCRETIGVVSIIKEN